MSVVVRAHVPNRGISLIEEALVPAGSSEFEHNYVAVGDRIDVDQEVRLGGPLQPEQRTQPQRPLHASSCPCMHGVPWPSQDGFLRGHGTQMVDGKLVATLCGVVERVNKLVYVRPLKSRYTAEQGDVVIGRVTEVRRMRMRLHARISMRMHACIRVHAHG